MKIIKNIFFIEKFPLNKEFFIRYEFEHLESLGYNIKFLDITQFLNRKKIESPLPEELLKYRVAFHRKSEFLTFLRLNSNDSLIVTSVSYHKSSGWMFYPIFRYKLPYVFLAHESFPSIANDSMASIKMDKIHYFFNKLSLDKIISFPSEFFFYILSSVYRQCANLIISSRSAFSSSQKKLINGNTQIQYSSSPDFMVSQSLSDDSIVKGDYAVFIDQYFCHHPDFKINHIIHSFTASQYYTELDEYFKEFTKKTGLKLVIASHPRRSIANRKDFDAEYELYYNRTAELIKNAKVVLLHFSTAISFCILFKKPFVLLNSDMFAGSTVLKKIRDFANYFGKKDANMTKKEVDMDDLFVWDKTVYLKYEHAFLKHPKSDSKLFSERILNLIATL